MNQKDAVYMAVTKVFSDRGIEFSDGMNVSEAIDKTIRGEIQQMICSGFMTQQIELKDTPSNKEKLECTTKLNSYVSGLVNNWLRRDERLNGGIEYQPKNPGSRAGQGDPQLKALRALHKQFEGVDADKADTIKKQIDTRVALIQAERAKKVSVDLSVLPDELIEQLGLNKE